MTGAGASADAGAGVSVGVGAGAGADSGVPVYRHAGRILALSMFIQGACGLIYEYTLGALGNHLVGTSHEAIFVVIGVMMFSMGVGSVAQRLIERDLVDRWLLIEICLGLAGGTSVVLIQAAFAYTTQYRLVLYLFSAFLGGCIGLEIPLLIRINQDYAASLRANLSSVLFMDYAGSLAGALLFAYVLLTRFSMARIGIALGLINISLGLLGALYFRRLLARPRRLLAAGGSAALLLLLLAPRTAQLLDQFEQSTFTDPIILSETTPYQHIVLTRRGDRLNLYLNGNLQFSSRDEQIYHELLVHPAMALADAHRRVLILGGGDGLALREVLKYTDLGEVLLVDLDARMTEIAATQPDLVRLNQASLRDARVRTLAPGGVSLSPQTRPIQRDLTAPVTLHEKPRRVIAHVNLLNLDADLYLRSADGLFDVILVDFPDPSTLEVAKLYSRSFYRNLAAHLAPGGFVAVQSTSPYHAGKVFLCIGKTLRAAGFSVLPYHQNVPSFGEWGWHLAWLAPPDSAAVAERIRALPAPPVETAFLTPAVLRGALAFGKGLLDASSIEINTRLRPSILAYHRSAWKE